MKNEILGRIHSLQSLGTLDGPGVRFVAFLQGCPLRCACCHNPETQTASGGTLYTPEELFLKAMRYKSYFGTDGGVTLSGGEPLLQAEFAAEFFALCRKKGINTCLDTSGCLFDRHIERLLSLTDYCLLDIKYTDDEKYRRYVGCSIEKPLAFLSHLDRLHVPTRIRQVIIDGLNNTEANVAALKKLTAPFSSVTEIELLPFRNLCQSKYDRMGVPFPLSGVPETTAEEIRRLETVLA